MFFAVSADIEVHFGAFLASFNPFRLPGERSEPTSNETMRASDDFLDDLSGPKFRCLSLGK